MLSPSKDVSAFEPQFNISSIPATPPADESIEITFPFDIPVEELESTLDKSLPLDADSFGDATNTTYTIIESRSNNGKHKLLDSQGYSYCKKKTNGEVTWWNCTVCNKKVYLLP